MPACVAASSSGEASSSEPSLAASYLVLSGARAQGMNLSLTPACKQTKYRGKDELRGRGCGCLHAVCPSPLLSPLLSLISPPHFPLVSARNQTPPPSFTDVLNL
ncbi:unnamed protein product [Pleuronectes platessa]|uniref:Uncharacterized protein n=1 Tax=Pleuronectes platessa TaxID=8262 RepID=A0A9N7V8G3_PLEPL|nr:unnamed protein product [Pleuronectes platessa]